MRRHSLRALLAGAAVVAFMAVGELDFRDAKRAESHYCEMVRLYHETDGRHGWPPYKGDEHCETE